MNLMNNLRKGLDRAREEASELAQTTMLRREMGKLSDRRADVCRGIGERLHARVKEGKSAHGFEDECEQIDRLDAELATAQAEIDRLRADEGVAQS